ncbi:uncharacterized protein VICG_01215 [Vittaforma corneae ATCC 50505]|uniref:RRM domain-containing protein n=1 Tax=Vittaforma corneae (strain ATCC 50505) TaxID=993615 RepID=L2GLI8_VITCO|nr:uncharacterized protein VICG_01215 [Vittaforma corneae ATCC 50505]ELA41711.1 hypothetical protein VICG_01215 [Vittaforma corneae ATCC 50505]
METVKFKPDLESIKERSKIVPFGRAGKEQATEAMPIPFILYNTEQEIKIETEESSVYRPSTIFQPSMMSRVQSEVSVKITNVPIHVTQSQLVEAIFQRFKDEQPGQSVLRPYTRLNLIFDKEKKASRGFAYANCENLEKARELARIVRSIVIDACVLGAEILE